MAKQAATINRRRAELDRLVPDLHTDWVRLERVLTAYVAERPHKAVAVQAFRIYFGFSTEAPVQTYAIAKHLGKSQSWVRENIRKLVKELSDPSHWQVARPKVRRVAVRGIELEHYEIAALLTMWRMRSVGTKGSRSLKFERRGIVAL